MTARVHGECMLIHEPDEPCPVGAPPEEYERARRVALADWRREVAATTPRGVAMTMWVIYERPQNFPCEFVLLRHFVKDWRPGQTARAPSVPDSIVWLAPTLELARLGVPHGLLCMPRFPEDDPHIVEVWL